MPAPVPSAQPSVPSRLCLGASAELFCFAFFFGGGGMFMTVSLPCNS